MNTFGVTLVIFIICVSRARSYETEMDNIPTDMLVQVDYLRHIIHCILELHECPEVTPYDIGLLEEAIKTRCEKCKVGQKQRVKRMWSVLKEHMPKEYNELKQKFDPENKFMDHFEEEISKH